MTTKICPKCGKEKPARGFNFHVNSCKGGSRPRDLPSLEIISEPVINKVSEITKMEKTTEEILKDVPGIYIQSAIQTSLNKERELAKKITEESKTDTKSEEETQECVCKGFDGESLFCPVHKPIVCCPGCKCINSETKLGYMDPLQTYRCSICGLAYQRHAGTGEYLYD